MTGVDAGTGTVVDVERPSGPYRSANVAPLTDVRGRESGELSLAPPLLVRRVIEEMRAAPRQGEQERLAALALAGELFATTTLEGESPEEYCRAQAAVSGLPLGIVRRVLARTAEAGRAAAGALAAQRPAGALSAAHWDSARGAAPVWVRKGEVLGVLAPGNHPATHLEWLGALALGYRVAVRPSRRDPFTPRRLVRALRQAGLAPGYTALLPTRHEHAEALLEHADRGLVYGGDAVVARYADSGRVLAQGPGRSKVLFAGGVRWQDGLATVLDSVAGEAGVQCLNASAVLCRDDHRGLARALAEELGRLPALAPHEEGAVLPVRPLAEAEKLARWLRENTGAGPDGDLVADLGDGSAVLRPAVTALDDPQDARFGVELPFPYAAVAPWEPQWRPSALGRTLALTVLGGDADLVGACLAAPQIRNTHWGEVPTHFSRPGLPHDGSLAEFLMETKTFARASEETFEESGHDLPRTD